MWTKFGKCILPASLYVLQRCSSKSVTWDAFGWFPRGFQDKTCLKQQEEKSRADAAKSCLGAVLKSYTKYPLYSHQNSLPLLIYIILINPTCTHEQRVQEKEEEKNVFEIRVCFIPALGPPDKNISGDH